MTIRRAICLGPFAGPLASSWEPLYPHARGAFGGVTPMTLCPSLFSSPSPSICLPHLSVLSSLQLGSGVGGGA
jgi:hypothetical protein